MKANLKIKGKKPNEVDITGILFRPHTNRIELYLEDYMTQIAPRELHSITIGNNGKATITSNDLQVINEIYCVLNWLREVELPMFEFGINLF